MRRVLLATGLSLCVAVAARGQELKPLERSGQTYLGPLPEAKWGKLGVSDLGKRYFLEGRWQQVHGDGLLLYRARIDTKAFLVVPQGPLKDRLTTHQAIGGALERRKSVIRVFGTASRGPRGVFIMVNRVEKIEDDAVRMKARLEGLGDDLGKIAALAKLCAARARRFEDPDLAELVKEITRRELTVRTKALGPKSFQQRLDLAQRYLDEVGDTAGAIALYAKVREDPAAPAALRKEARALLEKARAVRIRVDKVNWSWVTYEEFKRSEGFIQRKGANGVHRWIRRELAELQDAILTETKRQEKEIDPPRINPNLCAKDARKGNVRRGQTFAEVKRAIGLPKTVYHLDAPLMDDPKATWSQWVMADGRRIYFANGWVISKIAQDQPWPKE